MKEKYSRYFLIFISLVIIYVSFLLVRPYISALLSAIILTYIFYPIYRRINRIIKNKDVSAFMMIVLMLLIVMLPIVLIANALLGEFITLYNSIMNLDLEATLGPILENLGKMNVYVMDIMDDLMKFGMNAVSRFIISIPARFLEVFIIMFTSFYLFKEGPNIFERMRVLAPLKEEERKLFFREFNNITKGIIYSIFACALAQGIAGGIGFWFFGVSSPILWGIMMTGLALIPMVGPSPVWGIASIYLIVSGNFFSGMGLFLYGTLVISTVDNVIRTAIVGKKAKVHPVVTLIGVLGGLSVFGFIGVILGPIMLSFLILLIKFYEKQQTG